jgi:dTDP-4-amino-4,6-dideoxygalactose transaminase
MRSGLSPITFVASANCALYCGVQVEFVDIDTRTFNLGVESLAEKLAQAEKSGLLPKVVIPVNLCGQSCDVECVHALRQQYGSKIIEDASHDIGGKYQGEPIGNCRYSDITVFSFHPVKIITSGAGEMAVNLHYLPVYKQPHYVGLGFQGWSLRRGEAVLSGGYKLADLPRVD